MGQKPFSGALFAILQKYDFSSKSQPTSKVELTLKGCLRYCKSTIFQANHNPKGKSIIILLLFAILQKYDFSSKSQPKRITFRKYACCLRYCKSTIFQANHNTCLPPLEICQLFAILQKYDFSSKSQQVFNLSSVIVVVCDTAKVRFFKQITTERGTSERASGCLRYCKSTIFQANHNNSWTLWN